MNNKQRGERIREHILADISLHPTDITKHISSAFSITPQAVNSHLQRLEKDQWITSTGKGKGKRYYLGDKRQYQALFDLDSHFSEDTTWSDHVAFIFDDLPENIVDICHYGFTEMVNNVIDHSEGQTTYVETQRDPQYISITIADDGEGIFSRIKRLCNLHDEKHAILELSKGKLTTDPANHTGEGIFFTSRVFDTFNIDSKGIKFNHSIEAEYDWLDDSHPLPMGFSTRVDMKLKRDSNRKIQNVFDKFSSGPDEYQFNKTVIPVRLAQYENEKLVSRSQAKRLLTRIEKFQNVVIDFKGVSTIGQAFADEIFRVYAGRHPEIHLRPINMEENVRKMITRANSTILQANPVKIATK